VAGDDSDHAHTTFLLSPDGDDNLQVIQMNKFGGAHTSSTRRPPGSEPGVDPRRATANALYSHVHELCEIEVADYSTSNAEFNQYDNKGFVQLMQSTKGQRPSWAKVRWINIGGISWDVLSSLALAYGMFTVHLIRPDLAATRLAPSRGPSRFIGTDRFFSHRPASTHT
jgi:hypothetical protein